MSDTKKVKRFITVKTQFQFMHRWPEAPEGKHDHLRNLHRHMFHVEFSVTVDHHDRDIEFLALKDELEAYIRLETEDKVTGWRSRSSCEDIAQHLINWGNRSYPDRLFRVTVLEDNENGATLTEF